MAKEVVKPFSKSLVSIDERSKQKAASLRRKFDIALKNFDATASSPLKMPE